MRTFVAVELDADCRAALLEAVRQLRAATEGVRWVKEKSLHVTLKFIGEISKLDLATAIGALQEAAGAAEPFTVRVAGISGFPPRGTPRVIHAEAHEPTGQLQKLHDAVEKALAEELAVSPENRRYIPHVTLGRVKRRRECASLDQLSAAVPDQEFGQVDVDSMVLMESELRPDGAVYTVLHRFPLGAEA